MLRNIITPPALVNGDTIAIVSPAGATNSENVHHAAEALKLHGFKVRIYPHALGRHGSYSGTYADRLKDLTDALLDPEVKAILCSRGGYGAVHLLEALDELPLRDNPKWIIGFSDISCLHALMAKHGIESLHAPMTKHMAANGCNDADSEALLAILRGDSRQFHISGHHLNRHGMADGRLTGGNMAVLGALMGTKYDIYNRGDILFIEDVSEPVYKVERMMYQMMLAGVFNRISGLIVGQFTNYSTDADSHSMEEMIRHIIEPYAFPVAFNVPVGHVAHNIPLRESAPVKLHVTPIGVTIAQ